MLTAAQSKTLDYIRQYIAEHDGLAPTVEEIRVGIGSGSKSSVARLLRCLADRGAIRRMSFRARAIEIVDARCPHCGGNL